MSKSKRSAWAHAAELAELTPESRNRYVDFLRAASILVVVTGHWLMAAPYLDDGSPQITHLLDIAPWARLLTWVLQVMPVFFFVGGFSNGTSWSSALRNGKSYSEWLSSRLRRLIGPVLPLIFVWAAMAAVASDQGVHPEMIRIGSKVALIPTWFIAVYVLVVLFVPISHRAWERFGFMSILVPVAAAILVDVAFFAAGFHALGWINYLFIWLAVHQLGYAWHAGRLKGPTKGLVFSGCGLAVLVALVEIGPYPVSLVGVPGQEISNTQPPKIPLLALAAFQIGLLLSIETAARRWLAGKTVWTATVLINGMIMTIFLWHSTVMMLLVGLAFWSGGVGLGAAPNSGAWWALRPVWVAVFAATSLPVIALFARFERPRSSAREQTVATWRLLVGSALTCFGLAMLAMDGVGGGGWFGLRVVPLVLPVIGTGLAGFGPLGPRR